MFEFIQKIIDDATYMHGEAVIPVVIHLFMVNEHCYKLDEENSQRFHTIVAKLHLNQREHVVKF